MQIANLIMALPGAAAQGLIWGIMAIGVYLTFRVLDIADLTVDGTMCTGGAVCVMMMTSGHNVWVSLLVATLAGMTAGLVTGIFHTFMGIPAILAGILTQLSLYSVNLKIMGKANQAINVDKYPILISLRRIKNVPITQNTILIVALFIVVIIAVLYWFFGTELGCSLRATGCNPNMSRAQGINTDFCKVLGLMISNGLVALSSALLAQYQGFADVNMGRGAIVIGLAAVIIGEAIFSRIFRNFALRLLAVAFGSILYYLVLQTVIWMGIDFVTVIGGNGAGKSTMLNAVAGVWPVDEGQIIIDGTDVTKLSEYKRAAYLGRVFQDPMTGTAATMGIEENLALAKRRGKTRFLRSGITKAEREEYKELLKILNLGLEDRLTSKVGLLSGGQRQALTLLMATLQKPKLLLLDEHTAALDPKTAAKVLDITDRIVNRDHLTTLMITHNMKDAIAHGNRLIMMMNGKIILDIQGEGKKKLTVKQLLDKFEEASGEEFSNDSAILG